MTARHVVIFLALALCLALSYANTPIEAATPDVPSCEAINSAGNLTIYRCLPNEGLPYLVNSNGFMILEN